MKRNGYRTLNEPGHAGCFSGSDQRSNLLDLLGLKRDGELSGRHTTDHTTKNAHLLFGFEQRCRENE